MNLAPNECISENIPSALEEILKRTFIENQSVEIKQIDIFFLFIVFLLTENGFVLIDTETLDIQYMQHIDKTHLLKWKQSTGVYEVEFVMNGFTDTLIKLILCPLGASSLINVFISDISSEVYTICLPVSHVVFVENSPIPMLCDIKNLSEALKNKIVAPVKSSILNYYGYSGASLIGLPEELTFTILLNLPVTDIINVGKTCKKLCSVINNEHFWHKLLIRDFSNTVLTADCEDWKVLYRNIYIMHQDSLHRARSLRGTLHDLMDISDYVSYIDNPMWDVII